jgi:phenylacetate-CoA ligase
MEGASVLKSKPSLRAVEGRRRRIIDEYRQSCGSVLVLRASAVSGSDAPSRTVAEFPAADRAACRAAFAFAEEGNALSLLRTSIRKARNPAQRRPECADIAALESTAPVSETERIISKEKPQILVGFAAAIESLADHLIETGRQVQPPRVVICAAMEVSDHCRQLAERAFRAPVANVYVTAEVGVIAWSCPQCPDKLHINEDAFELEILDADGQPCASGTRGEVVVTPLAQTSMPLLRYRLGDMAARFDERCVCGRQLSLMTPIQGRTAHTIRHSSGHIVNGPAVTTAIGQALGYEWVRRVQVREQEHGVLGLLLEVRRDPTEGERQRLLQYVQQAVSQNYQLQLQIVPAIPLAPSGKFQVVVPLAS